MYSQKEAPVVTQISAPPQTQQISSGGGRNSFSGSGIIGSLISTVGGLIDNWRNRVHDRKAMDAQIKENQKNRDWQEMMYNKYESPEAQVQQMQSAGINPYQQGVSSQSVGSASTSSLPTPSASNVGGAVAQGLQFMLSSRKLEADIKKQEAETRSIENNNMLFMASYNDNVQIIKESLRANQLSNEASELLNKLNRNAYFNEDGTIKDNPLSLDLESKKLQKTILESDTKRRQFEDQLSDLFGVQFHLLPSDLQFSVTEKMLLFMSDPVGYPQEHLKAQLSDEFARYKDQAYAKRQKEAYQYLHLLNEIEDGFEQFSSLWKRLSPQLKDTFFGNILGL